MRAQRHPHLSFTMPASPYSYTLLVGLFLVSLLLHSPRPCSCANYHTLAAGQALAVGDTLVSRNGKFALGFFPSGTTTTPAASKSSSSSDNNSNTTAVSNWYLGIWFNKIPVFTPVWIANRDDPFTDPDADPNNKLLPKRTLQISRDGNLVVVQEDNNAPQRTETLVVWSTTTTSSNTTSTNTNNTSTNTTNTVAELTHNGNLVVRDASASDASKVRWQSFDYPTDVYLPGSKLGRNKVTGLNRVFVSRKNRANPARGSYCVGVDSRFSQGIILSQCSSSVVYWASGTFSLSDVDPSDSGFISYNQIDNAQEQYYIYTIPNDTLSVYTAVETSGQIKGRVWVESSHAWRDFYTQPMNPCSVHAACGPFTVCTTTGGGDNNANMSCDCMEGFSIRSPSEWDLDDRAGGCTRNNQLDCATDRFLPVPGVQLAYDPVPMKATDADGCGQACATDCSCTAYSYASTTGGGGGGCSIWRGELLNTATASTTGDTLYLRLSAKDLQTLRENQRSGRPSKATVVTAASIAAGGFVIIALIVLLVCSWRRTSNTQDCDGTIIRSFTYSHLRHATRNFSDRLGGGGFGSVYKGTILGRDDDGSAVTTIAVKRLLDGARQGEKQFRAEVSSIGLIQHINLVKLVGFCCESDKRLLVYEHMVNGSLDVHLFNSNGGGGGGKDGVVVLDWSTRYQIAVGVARGLAYLHEGCRERIIHCDIKPENILLDASLVPKIADFGMAAIVPRDFSRVLTTFRGTIGYLAPEWIGGEAITEKVDAYSFGMVLLEIVSGRRNSPKVYTTNSCHVSYFPLQAITTMLHDGDVNSLVDPQLHGEFNLEEALRLCKVAFWCIQDNELDRPTMGEVVQALEGLHDVGMPPMPRQLATIARNEL
ncbi:G-type lectin S-receptor-like serine/threonine-protein kinase At2g19130 [Zea mays]|nr:G-type lectin S-receptor-like serine/threonine-protein kinase At2g19130 [Zea mays]